MLITPKMITYEIEKCRNPKSGCLKHLDFSLSPPSTLKNNHPHIFDTYLDVKWCALCFSFHLSPFLEVKKNDGFCLNLAKVDIYPCPILSQFLLLYQRFISFTSSAMHASNFLLKRWKIQFYFILTFRGITRVGWESQEELIMPIRACSSTISVVLDQLAKSPIKLSINNWIHSTDVIDLNWTRLWQGNICI